MKPSRRKVRYREAPDAAAELREAAAFYGIKREALGVREAKDGFSELLQRAADGEEIVITSDGEPLAMIVPYRPAVTGKPYRPNWAHLRALPASADSTPQIRAERDRGH